MHYETLWKCLPSEYNTMFAKLFNMVSNATCKVHVSPFCVCLSLPKHLSESELSCNSIGLFHKNIERKY